MGLRFEWGACCVCFAFLFLCFAITPPTSIKVTQSSDKDRAFCQATIEVTTLSPAFAKRRNYQTEEDQVHRPEFGLCHLS